MALRAIALSAAALLAFGAAAGPAAAAPAAAGPLDACTATSGAVVAVDFGHWGGGIVRGCDAHPTTGMNLLHNGGFTTTGTEHDGPGFVCRIGSGAFDGGVQHPSPAEEPCRTTPPPSAYWSYWIAPRGQDTWTYSPLGAPDDVPRDGEVEAWVFGATDAGGTTGGPSFTPDSVRAGGGGTPPPTTPTTSTPPTTGPPSAAADVPAAAHWLAGRLTDGDHVFNDAWGTPDLHRTADVAIALAAARAQNTALVKTAAYLTAHTAGYVYPNGVSAAPDPGAAARLALVTEILGGDPRAVGGHDLAAALTDNVCTAAGSQGACTAAGDFRGAFSPGTQALGVLALARAGVTPPAAAVARLVRLQCADGGFSGSMIAPGDLCAPDPTATAQAVVALHRAGGGGPALGKAAAYLVAAQSADGGFPAYEGADGGDTGTTSAAAQALAVLGYEARATAARSWLAARQGADGGFAADASGGDPDLYAGTQALLAVTGADLGTLAYDPAPPATAPTSPPATPPTTGPPHAGARPDLVKGVSYLTAPARLTGGRYYQAAPGTGFADFGLTIDGAFALAATGGDDAALGRITDFVRRGKDGSGRGVDGWTGIGTAFASGGSLAKEAVLAEVTGADPRAFGGHDLLAALDATLCAKADTAEGCAAAGNYANANSVFAQSLGVIAQRRAGDTARAAAPTAYLESLQNARGAWPSLIPPTGDGDVDSTAMAAMALDLVPGDSAAHAVAAGLAWIAKQQKADGGFPGAAGDSVNSAALAIQGLSLDAAAYAGPIAKARAFLAREQNTDGGFRVASDGSSTASDVRASTQAVGGTVGTSFGTLLRDLRDQKAAASGAAYLAGRLHGGDHLSNAYGPDYGLSADLALAFAAAGGQDAALSRVTGYLAAHTADYADPAGRAKFPGPYTGAAAKLAVLAEVTGRDPRAFGGFDLLATLTGHVCAAATADGACTAAGDFSQAYSTVSQSLGVLALARAGVTPPAAAVARLGRLQCADGGFSATLLAPGAACASEVDTTGYALQALSLVPGRTAAVAAARAYLVESQRPGGGYPGAAGVNADSTALAVQALNATSEARPGQARAGQEFLRSLQNGDGGFRVTAPAAASDTRATAQAVPALTGAALTTLTQATGPGGGTATPPGGTDTGGGTGGGTGGSASGGGAGRGSPGPGGTASGGPGGGSLAATGTGVRAAAVLAGMLLAAGGLLAAVRRRNGIEGRHR